MINSIGLPNRGLAGYLDHDLPALAWLPVPLITNVMGSTAGEFVELIRALDGHPQIAGFELNVSCPNVRTGLDLGSDPDELERLMQMVRPYTTRPVIVKLTPNTPDVAAVAAAAERAGADAVSLINTLRALALHPHRAGPWLGGGSGGLSGPAIRAVALEQVARVADRVGISVVGMGGVQSGADASDFLRAGATLVAVGTESFRDAGAGGRIARELHAIQSSAKSEFDGNRQPCAPDARPAKHLQNEAKGSGALNVA
jgi:dihydroorotate dehydrogenase (NAD+) catalytic subunit